MPVAFQASDLKFSAEGPSWKGGSSQRRGEYSGEPPHKTTWIDFMVLMGTDGSRFLRGGTRHFAKAYCEGNCIF